MKRIALTMGEPGGIGPEVAVRAVEAAGGICAPVLVGDPSVFEEARGLLKATLKLKEVERPSGTPRPAVVEIIRAGPANGYQKGRPTAEGGMASAEAVKKAVALALEGAVDAVVTAPISKEALRMAGLPWPGHTEMLAELTNAAEVGMMLMGGPLRVMLATIHTALRDVPGLVSRERVKAAIRLALRASRMLSLESPRIAVAALNPHAGEGGMFGHEEETAIAPAVREAAGEGAPVTGPYPPDTLFYRASRGEFDMVVSMYHDQGLIPLKLLAFESGVNVTVGLPIIRTSPGHGTAYGIAWQGVADPSSMVEAVKAAADLKLVP
jgi:4-hydroxythreonine-4-phosphate dehydrogenase